MAAYEAARAIKAERELGLAVAIRIAVGANARDWTAWVRSKESILPEPPKPPTPNEYEKKLAQDPNAIMRRIMQKGG